MLRYPQQLLSVMTIQRGDFYKSVLFVLFMSAPVFFSCSKKVGLPTKKISSSFIFSEHAFSFKNFGGSAHDSVLHAQLMARMYGADKVCLPPKDEKTCTLTPIATAYMRYVNHAIEGGRCEGFAVLSGLAAHGDLDLSSFGSKKARDLILTSKVGEELAYWFATQYLRDVVPSTTQSVNAVDAVKLLASVFSQPNHQMYRVGLARIDPNTGAFCGGHAVLATYVAPGTKTNEYVIGIYDNNDPSAEREIVVNSADNSWSYDASTNPNAPKVTYEGNLSNANSLYVAPIEPRMGVHACTFCSLDESQLESRVQVFGSANAEIIAVHASGLKVGEHSGAHLVEHVGGVSLPTFTQACVDCRDGAHGSISHHAQLGSTLEIRQSPSASPDGGLVDAINASVFGHGFVASVEGADVDPGEVHTLFLSGDGDSSIYNSPNAESDDIAKVLFGTDLMSGEQVYVHVEAKGSETIRIVIDPKSGTPTFSVTGSLAAPTSLVRIDTTNGEVFARFTIDLPLPKKGSARVVLNQSQPKGQVTVQIDNDGDGVFEENKTVPDIG